jgi:hypothetical protein
MASSEGRPLDDFFQVLLQEGQILFGCNQFRCSFVMRGDGLHTKVGGAILASTPREPGGLEFAAVKAPELAPLLPLLQCTYRYVDRYS